MKEVSQGRRGINLLSVTAAIQFMATAMDWPSIAAPPVESAYVNNRDWVSHLALLIAKTIEIYVNAGGKIESKQQARELLHVSEENRKHVISLLTGKPPKADKNGSLDSEDRKQKMQASEALTTEQLCDLEMDILVNEYGFDAVKMAFTKLQDLEGNDESNTG